MKTKFPATIYVYKFQERDGSEVLCVANSLDEIPEDQNDEAVASYGLNQVRKFRVKRDLI